MSLGSLLLGAALGELAGMVASRRAPRLWLLLTLASAAAMLFAAGIVLFGGGPDWEWQSDFRLAGERVHLRLDGISAFFLALRSVLGAAGALYSTTYWSEVVHPRSARSGRMWWSALLFCMSAVLLVSNSLHFLVAWELFTLSAYFLITLERTRPEVRAAGWLYLAASHFGTLCLFAFFGQLAAHTGTWDLGPLREQTALAPLFWLALVGFGIKSGLFPLHIWLPSAHANAPSHVSAMLSGMALKMGIYGLVRFSGWLPVPAAAAWTIAGLGVISAVLGVAFALGQHDLKRLLAYHSVENIGIILIGLGFALIATAHGAVIWGQLALAGALLHVWNHGLFKALLFLGAGSVLHATSTREMSRLGGLWRAMPWTAALFCVGAVAISGLPPLNGFISELLIYLGLFDAAISRDAAAWAVFPAAILLGMTGALALACFVKVCGVVFLGAPRSAAVARAHESGPAMRAPMFVLAAACAAIGLAPIAFWPGIARAIGAWQPQWTTVEAPTTLVTLGWANVALTLLGVAAVAWLWQRARRGPLRRAVTWDCGYAMPTARIQYTAGSFAGIITEWFNWILRPQRHVVLAESVFPVRASWSEHTPETILDYVVEPTGRMILQLSALTRRLQHGRLQSYIIYLLAGVAALTGLVMIGGAQ
jgi:hydrogenase-4 component B